MALMRCSWRPVVIAFGGALLLETILPTSAYLQLPPLLRTKTRTFSIASCRGDNHHHHQLGDGENQDAATTPDCSRRELFQWGGRFAAIATATSTILGGVEPSHARLDPVNRPELLPSEPNRNVIQIEKFLTTGQVKRMETLLANLEKDTGVRLRVLCQAYPQTPGLAVRDYWSVGKEDQKDDKYIVLVVDDFGGRGNVLNFNVGDGVKFELPNVFWTRLQAKYGTTFFVRENGIDLAIVNAVEAIATCLRSEEQYCVSVPDEGVSMRSLGM